MKKETNGNNKLTEHKIEHLKRKNFSLFYCAMTLESKVLTVSINNYFFLGHKNLDKKGATLEYLIYLALKILR